MRAFSADLSKLVKKANGNIDLVARKVMLELFRGVVMKTPVDTGRARANWVIGFGSVNNATSENTDKVGNGVLGTLSGEMQDWRFNDGYSIYFTNSLPYIRELEDGSSKQAPQGMVRLTLFEIISHYGT